MSEAPREIIPVIVNGSNLELTTTWPNSVSVTNFREEDIKDVIIYFSDVVAYGDGRTFDDENKAIIQRFKDNFIELDLEKVLKGEMRAFREMRFALDKTESGKPALLLFDNFENRMLDNGGLKEWLLDVIKEKETNKDTK